MEGIYLVTQVFYGDFYQKIGLRNSEFELFLLGDEKVVPGDRLGFLNDIHYDIVVSGIGEEGRVRCVLITDDSKDFISVEDIQGAYLTKRMNMYSGDLDWGPVRLKRQGYAAQVIKENYGGDQQTIIDTVKAIHEIYEGSK